MELVPAVLERKIVPKPWGGRALESLLGIELPAGAAVGEAWEVYDRPEGSSRLRGSDLTLRDLMQEDSRALLGRGVSPARGGRFPLLLKFIDAAQALSVQVHPDDAQAAEEGDSGKTEAWVVLHAGAKARIIHGVKPGVTREDFAAVAHTAAVEDLLVSFQPKVGDAVLVPCGTVHAIGPEVVLFEIQQNSDVTYRIWDWGRGREVHIEKALRAMRLDRAQTQSVAPEKIAGGAQWLVRCPSFRVRRFTVDSPSTLGSEGTFKILSVISGHGAVGWRSGGRHAPLTIGPGDTVLVPACTSAIFVSPVGAMSILWSDPGQAP